MRLLLGLLGAVVCHGLAFGVVLAFLPDEPAHPTAVAALDVEVVPARPDPVAPAPAAVPAAVPARPPRHVRPRPQAAAAPSLAPAPPASKQAASPLPSAGAGPAAGVRTAGVQAHGTPAPVAAAALSSEPRYRTHPAPEYPTVARRLREEGSVLVRVSISADGLPTAVAVERSCGHPLLDDAAVEAVRRSTFEPARAAGTPVPSRAVLAVRFSLDDGR